MELNNTNLKVMNISNILKLHINYLQITDIFAMDLWPERQHIRKVPPMSMEPWAPTRKALHQYVGDTCSCPGPYPTVVCPQFHVGCRLRPPS